VVVRQSVHVVLLMHCTVTYKLCMLAVTLTTAQQPQLLDDLARQQHDDDTTTDTSSSIGKPHNLYETSCIQKSMNSAAKWSPANV
jgi:hypothetical protein